MTGKPENNKKICPICGGRLTEGTTAATFFIGQRIVVIKDLPAEVCSDCDEAYVKSGVAGDIEEMLAKLEELQSEISVLHYKIA